ncbi:MAG: hypothetical protein ABIJ09_08855 [Pseudomonadota bacterium]
MRPRARHPVPAPWWLAAGILLGLACPHPAQAFENDAWLGEDKVLHVTASAVIASGGYSATHLVVEQDGAALLVGGALALGAGAAKEVYDVMRGSDASYRDLAWDLAGTVLGLATTWCLLELLAALHTAGPCVVEPTADASPGRSLDAATPALRDDDETAAATAIPSCATAPPAS